MNKNTALKYWMGCFGFYIFPCFMVESDRAAFTCNDVSLFFAAGIGALFIPLLLSLLDYYANKAQFSILTHCVSHDLAMKTSRLESLRLGLEIFTDVPFKIVESCVNRINDSLSYFQKK